MSSVGSDSSTNSRSSTNSLLSNQSSVSWGAQHAVADAALISLMNDTKNPNNLKDREKITGAILGLVDTKLHSLGSPPPMSPCDDYGKFHAGIAYLFHKDLKTLPPDRLEKIKSLIVDGENWKEDSHGDITPCKSWGLSTEDFKNAIKEAVVGYVETKGLDKEKMQPLPSQKTENDEQNTSTIIHSSV